MLNATLHLHLKSQNFEKADDMLQNIYVDNVILGGATEESVMQYFRKARAIMSEANFNLRSWASNSLKLQAIVQEKRVADINQVVNLLDLHWDTSTDQINFIPKRINYTTDSAITKRRILQCSSRIFDPLGILSPVSIRAKLFMQELWQKNVGWDEPLEQSVREKWNNIVDDLRKAAHVFISRHYFNTDQDCNIQELHTFADASLKAYGAVVYL